MKTYILLSKNALTEQIYESFIKNRPSEKWVLVRDKDEFTLEKIRHLAPTKIFIPHWSHLIPPEITSTYESIVFHITDLPYGRGGSPLQNLIVRGHTETKVSAIRIDEGIDTGDVYLKKPLRLEGSAAEIHRRTNPIIAEMIEEIIDSNIAPVPQKGDAVVFRRRGPAQSNISALHTPQRVYDHIRMLDAPGYPLAYLTSEWLRFEFSEASLQKDGSVRASVTIKPRRDKTDKEILDTIEGIREENNKNWVDLLRLAMSVDAPRMREYIQASLGGEEGKLE